MDPDRLTKLDERQGKIVELRFFGGLTVEQTADLLGSPQDREEGLEPGQGLAPRRDESHSWRHGGTTGRQRKRCLRLRSKRTRRTDPRF